MTTIMSSVSRGRATLVVAILLGVATAAHAQSTTALFIDSQPGDYVGQGRRVTLTSVDATFSSQTYSNNQINFSVVGPSFSVYWYLDFRIASGALPVAGDYYSARRAPFTTGNGLSASGNGGGCNELTGRFRVLEAVYSGTQVVRFAADFEQHCEDMAPALFGAIRYNSTVSSLVPFAGQYPSVKLSISPLPSHGRVVGQGLNCGGGNVACEVSPPIGALGLTAIPDAGYIFAGWAQDCSGAPATTINVNSEKICSAVFLPIVPDAPRSIAVFVGSPGDYISGGKTYYLSSGSSRWTLESGFGLQLTITHDGPTREEFWNLRFSSPTGQSFVAGQQYTIARFSSATAAGFDLTHNSNGCSGTSGTLRVREWVPGAGSAPERFLFDFEYRCDNSPPLAGIIQYQSTVALPVLQADRSALSFGITRNSSTIVAHTPDQVVQLVQIGAGTTSWQLKSDQPWLTATPATGTGSGTITIKIKEDGIVPLSSQAIGHISIITAGAISVPPPITVTATLLDTTATAGPFGAIDSPVDNLSGVYGSIPITGWALDDIGITGLRLYRSPVPGEANQLVFIGNPVRVEGARPDVAGVHPSLPMNTAAGWGYMLLTNMLPNGGNGPFTFHVYADDVEGHATLLGSRTIVCSNSNVMLPFGAIDTPGQGAMVSGVTNNFGWVLSPGTRRADPPGGGTVQVFIDGVPVGVPGGWTSRADLSALFPASQYFGVGTALGVYTFDTTLLADGTHTIAWAVTDNFGGAAGVGSRYFTVFNGTGLRTAASTVASRAALTTSDRTISADPIAGRLGFGRSTPFRDFFPDAAGTITVQAEELDRIELRIGARAGHLMTAADAEQLPIGAVLDSDGTFTWQPGVAYVGTYHFVFDTDLGSRRVTIVLNPKGTKRAPRD